MADLADAGDTDVVPFVEIAVGVVAVATPVGFD